MFTHPAITASLAAQHRRDLITQASACRQARAARRTRSPVRRPLIVKALRATAAASAIATAAFLMTPAGPSHAPAANGKWTVHFQEHGNGGTSDQGDVHYVVHNGSRWS